jgi:protein SCO1/2
VRKERTRQFPGVKTPAVLVFALMASAAPAQTHPGAGHASATGEQRAPATDEASISGARRSLAEYVIPNVTLLREDGTPVNLPTELNDGRPVVLNFVYTSCTTICPMSSQVFEEFQHGLGMERASVHLVSISIDPEQDTPARLQTYAAQFHASKSWNHYSGSLGSVTAVQRAFNAYFGDKMSHVPLTLLRAAPGMSWVRFDGFARADELLAERNKWRAAVATRNYGVVPPR